MAQSIDNSPAWRRGGYSDLILAAGVLLIMSLMVLRLPTPVIDALVAVNISVGVCLLLIAIYVPSPVTFNSFPSVLLISTLFRLALTVATTRLILLEADAGDIIHAFGSFVAGGNVVVGIVVFVIITVVQFIVIAKGAERVAEVSARFTLDAMPGKQLSIDSDLRSGLIEKEEARRRRTLLESESQLNGALDGAMKFVKGDAIASIVIVIVNLVGGLTVGMAQRGLDFGSAMETYTILTIGDGMVAQIPALLSAMAAGLVVTRTTGNDDRHLGVAIAEQMTAQPRALALTAAMALLLALTPGFPTLIFLTIAGVLFAGSGLGWRNSSLRPAETGHGSGVAPGRAPAGAEPIAVTIATPLIVELPQRFKTPADFSSARLRIERAHVEMMEMLGIPIPQPEVRIEASIEVLRLRVFDVAVTAFASDEAGSAMDDPGAAFKAMLLPRVSEFLGIQEVTDLLEIASKDYPALVRDVNRHLANSQIAEVLRNLVDEGVPVRNLRGILESLAEHGEREKHPAELTELVRIGLRHALTELAVSDDGVLHAMALAPDAEAIVRAGLQPTPAGIVLSLPAMVCGQLREAIATGLKGASDVAPNVSLLTPADIRRHVRQLIEIDFPALRILSYPELSPGQRLDITCQIGIQPTEEAA